MLCWLWFQLILANTQAAETQKAYARDAYNQYFLADRTVKVNEWSLWFNLKKSFRKKETHIY